MKKIYTSIDIGSDTVKFLVAEEINGKIYLNKSASENAEYSNYHSGLIGSYVFIGIGTVLEVFAVIYFIKIKKIKNEII